MTAIPKPRPRLLDKQASKRWLALIDRTERLTCKQRSGGRCEVQVLTGPQSLWNFVRCTRRASENHHLIGGSGRRGKGMSILAAHRLAVCSICHHEITNHVLVPVDGTKAEVAATVRYERRR